MRVSNAACVVNARCSNCRPPRIVQHGRCHVTDGHYAHAVGPSQNFPRGGAVGFNGCVTGVFMPLIHCSRAASTALADGTPPPWRPLILQFSSNSAFTGSRFSRSVWAIPPPHPMSESLRICSVFSRAPGCTGTCSIRSVSTVDNAAFGHSSEWRVKTVIVNEAIGSTSVIDCAAVLQFFSNSDSA